MGIESEGRAGRIHRLARQPVGFLFSLGPSSAGTRCCNATLHCVRYVREGTLGNVRYVKILDSRQHGRFLAISKQAEHRPNTKET